MGVILRKILEYHQKYLPPTKASSINNNVILRYFVMRLQTNIVNDNVLSIYL